MPRDAAVPSALAIPRKKHEEHSDLITKIVSLARRGEPIDLDAYFTRDVRRKQAANAHIKEALGITELVNSRGRLFANNFATELKRAGQAAAGILDLDATIEPHPEKGTLWISGPIVEREFGQSHVLLDDTRNHTTLRKPSFASLRDLAAARRNSPGARSW